MLNIPTSGASRPGRSSAAPGVTGTKNIQNQNPTPTPQPTESFTPAAKGPSAGKIALGVLAAGGALVALSGCSAPDAPPPAEQCTSNSWETSTSEGQFKVEVLPEQLGSIDLIRQTETTTSTDSDGDTETDTDPVALSPIGVYLGDGIFFDTNGNLRLVPARAFGLQITDGDASSITVEQQGILNDLSIERDGGRVVVDGSGFGRLNSIVVTEGANGATINPHGFGNWNSIKFEQRGNRTIIDPHGFGSWDQIVITRDGNRTTIEQPGWFHTTTTITRTENSIKVDPPGPWNTSVAHFCGDHVKIDPTGPWNDTEIHRDGQNVEVTRRGAWNDSSIELKPEGGAVFRNEGPLNDITVRQR